MTGILFDYSAGRIDVRFEHGEFYDKINMHIRMQGATVTSTPCDDQLQKGESVVHADSVMEFMVYMTSLWCPFNDYIRFLEAIAIQVQECSFAWDAEGPDALMKWERRFVNKQGYISVEWMGRGENFKHRMMLETRQAVSMLYGAFRKFVESTEYEPLRYERLTIVEALFYGLGRHYSQDEIITYIKFLDIEKASILIESILQRASLKHRHLAQAPESLEELRRPMEFEECIVLYSQFNQSNSEVIDVKYSMRFIPNSWSEMNALEREISLRKLFMDGFAGGGDGVCLLNLRSPIIESYLAYE